jgi:hypothetical protein
MYLLNCIKKNKCKNSGNGHQTFNNNKNSDRDEHFTIKYFISRAPNFLLFLTVIFIFFFAENMPITPFLEYFFQLYLCCYGCCRLRRPLPLLLLLQLLALSCEHRPRRLKFCPLPANFFAFLLLGRLPLRRSRRGLRVNVTRLLQQGERVHELAPERGILLARLLQVSLGQGQLASRLSFRSLSSLCSRFN